MQHGTQRLAVPKAFHGSNKRRTLALLARTFCTGLGLLFAGAAGASTFLVTSNGDDVNVASTLRYAVAHAKSNDLILIASSVKDPIVLTHGELVLNQNVAISGLSFRPPTISGNGTSRIFEIAANANVVLNDLNFVNGNSWASNPAGSGVYDGQGGAIINFGTLLLTLSTFSNNTASYGGGLTNPGSALVIGCVFSHNTATTAGGGIRNEGTLGVTDSLFSYNNATVYGGGLSSPGTAQVYASALYNNTASYGGGISSAGTLTVALSIVANNSASVDAGGIYNNQGTLSVGANLFASNAPNPISGAAYTNLGGNAFN